MPSRTPTLPQIRAARMHGRFYKPPSVHRHILYPARGWENNLQRLAMLNIQRACFWQASLSCHVLYLAREGITISSISQRSGFSWPVLYFARCWNNQSANPDSCSSVPFSGDLPCLSRNSVTSLKKAFHFFFTTSLVPIRPSVRCIQPSTSSFILGCAFSIAFKFSPVNPLKARPCFSIHSDNFSSTPFVPEIGKRSNRSTKAVSSSNLICQGVLLVLPECLIHLSMRRAKSG
mmetsp:Transcript_34136/g.108272  ORF Transcript_34136/g.108272 Transcript_34136/m.108272 type:complete len:233 (-) Transcript_34136:2786-3484(-)